MKKSHNKIRAHSLEYVWLDPSKSIWARPFIGDLREGIVGHYLGLDQSDPLIGFDSEKGEEDDQRAI